MTTRRLSKTLCRHAAVLLLATGAGAAWAQPHGHAGHAAHQHGKASLDIAVERQSLAVQIETPLDSLLGFERAPRTDAERQAAAQALAKLREADKLLVVDPAAGCTLAKVDIDAPVLGEPGGQPQAPQAGHGAQGAHEDHAELQAAVEFRCTDASLAKYIDVGLADAFRRIRTIDVQVAAPQGQLKRTLTGKARRVNLTR
ncbi:DUF2796 domain-containing protein [Aquincola sp. MAHUQ-54]|uniref:DUF2796 domain-containing protein n=1 Tax=Aquincola agrisoli TaxID=3119538 RepID=A0AAW9Q9Q4_9BURK